MYRVILNVMPLAALLLAYTPLTRTPNPSTWTREVLLGTNDQAYVSYVFERKNPGSYYQFTEKLYLYTFNVVDGSVAEKHLLRETLYQDTTTLGDWARRDTVYETIDVGQYLADRTMDLVFPESSDMVEVTEEGVFLRLDNLRECLIPARELKNVLADPPGLIRLVEQYTTPFAGYRFLSISSGYGGDQDAATRILPVSEAEYMRALHRLHERLEAEGEESTRASGKP